jgi:hypothetical protein
VWT